MNNYDGWVVVGTRVDNKQLEKDLKVGEKKLEKYEKEAEKLTKTKEKIDVEVVLKGKEFDRKIKEIKEKSQIDIKAVSGGNYYTRHAKAEKINETAQLKINALTEKYNQYLETANSKIEKIDQELLVNAKDQALLNQKIKETKDKLGGVHVNFGEIGKSIGNTIKKVGKWVLAIFSVRTAYTAVSQAMSTLSQYNEGLADKLESIKLIAASALEPIVNRLVDLVYRLLTYVNYLSIAWFKVDLFASANDKKLKSSVKSAKEMKKTLAGFDEMNVLQDTSSSSTSGSGGSAITMPEDVEIPGWLVWIKEHGAVVAGILGLIGAAILGIKFYKFFSALGNGVKSLSKFSAGLALIVVGIIALVGSIANLILNWDTLSTKEKVVTVALGLIGAAFIALGYAIAAGISAATLGIGAIIAAVVALVTALGTLIFKWATEEKSIKDVTKAQEDLKNAQDEYASAQDEYVNAVDKATEAFNKLNDIQNETGISGEDLYNKVQNGTLDYANMTEQQKEVYKAYLDNIKAQDTLKTSTEKLEAAKQKEKIATWESKLAQEAQNGAFKDGGEKAQKFKEDVINAYENGELSADEARELIGKSMSEMSRDAQKAFAEDLPNSIKDGLNPKKYETFGQKFSKFFEGLWSGIKNGASSAWNTVKGWFGFSSGGVVYGSGSSGFAKGGIAYSSLPKLASGAIINTPGRGVPIVSAIGGERGKEGIIPLTDSQQMSLLGEAIGKYITVNLNNVNTINGRVLSRELKKINSRSDFAYNE